MSGVPIAVPLAWTKRDDCYLQNGKFYFVISSDLSAPSGVFPMSASTRRLPRDEQQLSDRDLAVVMSVAEHRFLSAQQVEELHFFEHQTKIAGARVCRKVLARLNRDRVLTRLNRRVGGVRAGSASFVYTLGPIGRRIVGGTSGRSGEPSALFLDHTLAIADAHIDLVRADREGEVELLKVQIEPACWRRYTGRGGAPEVLRPDLYIVTGNGDYEDFWFLEIDRSTESPAAISRKCRAYDTYRRSGREQDQHGAFPLVVWVTPDDVRKRKIESVIGRLRNVKRDLFTVTTVDGLVPLVVAGAAGSGEAAGAGR